MNTKTAKLLRKYCKVYSKDYSQYKKNFNTLSKEEQFNVIGHLHGALKPVEKANPPLSPTDKKKDATPVRGVKVVGVGD